MCVISADLRRLGTIMTTPADESPSKKPTEGEKPWRVSPPTRARTVLGTTLAIFFTITGIGAAFQATCIATTIGAESLGAGMFVGVIAAVIAAGALLKLFWGKPPSPPV
jgi:hypothetical protein